MQSFHGYPVSMFPGSHSHEATSFKCFDSNTNAIELCNRDTRLCPVTELNINAEMGTATWPLYLDAISRLGNEEQINVFYLGGSMTRGADTNCECICQHDEDSRCPPLEGNKQKQDSRCSWTTHLTGWLKHAFPATKFGFYDYSAGGHSSASSDYLVDRVHKTNTNLSAPALFFLDFSVNDAQAKKGAGVEGLICNIYQNVGAYYNIVPTVVVIEQYPHAHFRPSSPLIDMGTERDYAVEYRNISRHYSAVHISLREVF